MPLPSSSDQQQEDIMSISRSIAFAAALFCGSAIGCHQDSRDTTPRTPIASSESSINPPAPQYHGGLPCNNATINGRAGNPNCEEGGVSGTNTNSGSTRSSGASGPTLPEPPPHAENK